MAAVVEVVAEEAGAVGKNMMDSIVLAQNLTKKFKQLTAVDGISFSIRPGECFGFLGPNGAGKTSTIKMIHCVSPVTAGTLLVSGMPAHVDNRAIKKMTGVVPQELNLDNDLSVYENLLIFSQFFDMPRAVAVQWAATAGLRATSI